MSKKCPKCGNKEIIIDKHELAYCTDCEMYEPMELFPEQSVFDQLTASPEVLAPNFVYFYQGDYPAVTTIDGKEVELWWRSMICKERYYETKEEAIAATVARLNEVAE